MKKKPEALLLIGPTGAGKTPLGDYLEANGLAGQRCAHFDFGANLRAAAAGELSGVDEEERSLVQDLLERGALLESEHFGVAARILDAFRSDRGLAEGDLLVLNGLPRHAGQADDGQAHIANKLALYAERTRHLVERYTQAGVPVYSFSVGLHTAPAEIHAALESCLG